MITGTIPVLHVASSRAAQAFYCDKLGFTFYVRASVI